MLIKSLLFNAKCEKRVTCSMLSVKAKISRRILNTIDREGLDQIGQMLDPDQRLHFAWSNLGLQSLLRPVCPNTV